MQLSILKEWIERFKKYLAKPQSRALLHLYESQQLFAQHWDTEAADFATMYDQSLQNNTTKRLWKREAYEPKRLLLAFTTLDADYLRFIFRDLFNEAIEPATRASRFIFHCDELLQQYKTTNPRSIDNNHYHDDYQMVCLYLAFRYPKQYTLYHQEAFQAFLRLLNSRNILESHDMERFFKIMRTVQKLLLKEEELIQCHLARFPQANADLREHLLLAYEFYRFCTASQVKPPF
ncbi:MAG: hypothetical protein AAF798_19650 [Bacteroidota bacterium]